MQNVTILIPIKDIQDIGVTQGKAEPIMILPIDLKTRNLRCPIVVVKSNVTTLSCKLFETFFLRDLVTVLKVRF